MKTKPFDLQAAMNGAKLVTRDGREAKFIAYVPEADDPDSRLLALIQGEVYSFGDEGNYIENEECRHDLFLAVQTGSINGHEYQRVAPKDDTRYWIPITYDHTVLAEDYLWVGGKTDLIWLRRGLVHLTREAAEAHARAIILAGGGEV